MGREARQNAIRARASDEAPRTFGISQECDKCGLPRAHPQFLMKLCEGRSLMDTSNDGKCSLVGQHLHLVCPRCEFHWPEWTKDSPHNEEFVDPEPAEEPSGSEA